MFKLSFSNRNKEVTQRVTLEIPYSGNAEGILRGLVHSGFEVTISEVEERDNAKVCDTGGLIRG